MIVKAPTSTTFNNEARAMFNVEDLRDAIKWYERTPVVHNKKIFMHGRYPAVSIYDKKIHIHRLLMMYYEDRDLESGEYVHHIDGDHLNSLRHNLEIQKSSNHQSEANKGRKQSASHIFKRINATCLTRYGHPYENPELLK